MHKAVGKTKAVFHFTFFICHFSLQALQTYPARSRRVTREFFVESCQITNWIIAKGEMKDEKCEMTNGKSVSCACRLPSAVCRLPSLLPHYSHLCRHCLPAVI